MVPCVEVHAAREKGGRAAAAVLGGRRTRTNFEGGAVTPPEEGAERKSVRKELEPLP